MVDRDCHAAVDDDDKMDITLAAEIKEELLDDADFDIGDVNSRLSDVEIEDDDDVVIVDAEKTMQYLSGDIYLFTPVMWQYFNIVSLLWH